MLDAVKQNGYSLRHAAPELKAHRELLFEAVKRNGYALQYAAPERKADREFVFEALSRMDSRLFMRHQSSRRTVMSYLKT